MLYGAPKTPHPGGRDGGFSPCNPIWTVGVENVTFEIMEKGFNHQARGGPVLADADGAIVESYLYDAWGNVKIYDSSNNLIDESLISNRYLWQGREYDFDTGLYNFRARWYCAETGRWLSKDPIGISGGLNQYVFCANNPVNFVDPLGQYWKAIGGAALGIAAGAAFVAGAPFTGAVLGGIAIGLCIWDIVDGGDTIDDVHDNIDDMFDGPDGDGDPTLADQYQDSDGDGIPDIIDDSPDGDADDDCKQ